MKPEFTAEELKLLRRVRHRAHRDAWGWVLVLLPFAAFAAYGVWRLDLVAVLIAWAGTFAWLVWWILASVRSGATLARILEKYDEAMRRQGGEDGGERS